MLAAKLPTTVGQPGLLRQSVLPSVRMMRIGKVSLSGGLAMHDNVKVP